MSNEEPQVPSVGTGKQDGGHGINFRPTSIATGLPWHVASRKRDKQLIAAAKKGIRSNTQTMAGASTDHGDDDEAVYMEVDEVSVDFAVENGADVNAADYNGNTALHYACEEGYQDVVEFLLSRKDISIDAFATMDWTPLHSASYKGRVEIIRALIAAGCDTSAVARDGNSALHFAAWGGHLEAVKVLVAAGVPVSAANDDGHTPLDVAGLFKNRDWQKIVLHLADEAAKGDTHDPSRLKKGSKDRFALQIKLVEGQGLKALDFLQNSDPYCACCLSNPPGFVRSKTIANTASPQWNQILLLRMNLAPQYLRFEVWDDDFGETPDDFIGMGVYNLSNLVTATKEKLSQQDPNQRDPETPDEDIWWEIKNKNNTTGKIHFILKIRKIPPD